MRSDAARQPRVRGRAASARPPHVRANHRYTRPHTHKHAYALMDALEKANEREHKHTHAHLGHDVLQQLH